MKICKSCGAELDDKEAKCPICDYSFTVAEAPTEKAEVQGEEVSSLLKDVRARIQQLAGISPKEEPGEPEPPTGETEAGTEPSVEEEAEEEQEGALTIESRPVRGELQIPGMMKKEDKGPKKPDKLGYKISAEPAGRKGGRRKAVVAASVIIVVVILLFASWYFLSATSSSTEPSIDGSFGEWTDVVKYQSYFKSDNGDIDFDESAVLYSEGSVYWYFSTYGTLFNIATQTSPLISTYSLFIDADGDPDTGFSLIQGFGADDVLMISGSSGQENSSLTKLYEFVGPDSRNWSSWKVLDSIVVGRMGDKVETSFKTPSYFNDTRARFMAFSYDGISIPSATLPFSLTPGILLIQQVSLVKPNGLIISDMNQPLLNVVLKGYGGALPISKIRPSVSGITETYNLGSVDWNESEMAVGRTLIFSVNTSSISPGTLVEAEITISSVVSDYRSVFITGEPARGYVTSMPSGFVIDGFFKEWTNLSDDLNDVSQPANPDIDIVQTGNETASLKTYFYLDVLGRMMDGILIPVEKRIPSPTTLATPWSSERITGEDVVRIYLDTDPGGPNGSQSPLNGSSMKPDLMIEICGKNGMIYEKVINYWTTGWYANSTIGLQVAFHDKMLEIGVFSVDLTSATYAIIMTDWLGNNDNVTGSL
jgi:hypothetical protein